MTQRTNMTAEKSFCIDGQPFAAPDISAGLYIVATPIGNLADITLRALRVLAACDVILCEDTRISARLLSRYDIRTKLKPYHDHNAAKQRPAILEQLAGGAKIALISDAGTPLVSDPGYKLVEACQESGLPVDAIPGASAMLTALTLSGLPSDEFQFCGFLPAKAAARNSQIAGWQGDTVTRIIYESPRRTNATLAALAQHLPDARVAVCRELTKLHQQVIRGTAEDVCTQLAGAAQLKGEVTIVVSPGAAPAVGLDSEQVRSELLAALQADPPSRAAGRIAKAYNLKKQDVYALALTLKETASAGT